MDLVEWVKKGDNVWKLESEAFKKPIKVEICYDEEDKEFFNAKLEEVQKKLDTYIALSDKLEAQITDQDEQIKAYEVMLSRYETLINEYEKKLSQKEKEWISVLKEVADVKTTQEVHSWAIRHLNETTALIQKKVTKQPTVIHDKCFVSWHEPVWIATIQLPDGDYLLNAKYVIWEHNEFVTNQNDLVFEKIHVEWWIYVPFYQLEWGTELDTPTATVYYDLVFMPI